jgi:hypothetical protein
MKRARLLALAVTILLAVLAPSSRSADTSSGTACIRIKNKCKLQIKQTKFGFQFGGIDFNSGAAKKVGSVSLNTDLIQKLSDVAQILDQMQYSRCQVLNSMTSCDSARQFALVVSVVGNEQLGQLAVLSQMYSDDSTKLQDALLKWIVQSGDVIQKIYAKQFMAADPTVAANTEKARAAFEYAVGKLNVSPQSPEFASLLSDPIRSQLK